MKTVRLQEASFGTDEINAVNAVLESTMVVMNQKCRDFEKQWSAWQQANGSVFVNSGSSANLLMISLLKSKRADYQLKEGDEVLIPAVTWSTTLFPVIQAGLKPVLVDVDPKTFNISLDSCKRHLSARTKAIFVVHLLGNPAHMDAIEQFSRENKLIMLEDVCESPGAEWRDKKVGNFGIASSFSFMFAHHLTTIEGGMVCCQSDLDTDVVRAQRAHGWIREISQDRRKEILDTWQPDDERFFFWDLGYNVRPTEINAVFGIEQLKKLERFIEIRNRNFRLYQEGVQPIMDKIQIQELEDEKYAKRSNFAFGLYIKDQRCSRKELMAFLQKNGIETRPLVAGNLARNPFYALYCQEKYNHQLVHSDTIHEQGLYLPNHQGLTTDDVSYVTEKLGEFFNG